MRISVVIPTFNRAELLIRALTSVLTQTHPADEIIVIDDGSTDQTRQTITDDFPEVSYHYQSNQGVSAARNTGVAAASGDWVAFLDSDDSWFEQKLARQITAIAQQPDAVICHCDEIWIRNGVRVNPMKKHAKSGGWIFEQCLPLCVISPSAVMIKRDILQQWGGFDESLPACEDYDLWLRLCAHFPVCFVNEPLLYKLGGHADQLSQKYWGMDRFRLQALRQLIDSQRLNSQQQQAASHMLVRKAKIYAQGAQKRNKLVEAQTYYSLSDHYAKLISPMIR